MPGLNEVDTCHIVTHLKNTRRSTCNMADKRYLLSDRTEHVARRYAVMSELLSIQEQAGSRRKPRSRVIQTRSSPPRAGQRPGHAAEEGSDNTEGRAAREG